MDILTDIMLSQSERSPVQRRYHVGKSQYHPPLRIRHGAYVNNNKMHYKGQISNQE